jgi:hypothetical protein
MKLDGFGEGAMNFISLSARGSLELDLGTSLRGSENCPAYAVVNFTTIGPIAKAIARVLTHAEEMRNKTRRMSKVETTQNNIICIAERLD